MGVGDGRIREYNLGRRKWGIEVVAKGRMGEGKGKWVSVSPARTDSDALGALTIECAVLRVRVPSTVGSTSTTAAKEALPVPSIRSLGMGAARGE